MTVFEPPPPQGGFFADLARLSTHNLVNAVVALLFSVTGPLVILLSVGRAGGLGEDDIASWIFGGYALGGAITFAVSLVYRQPISLLWTIPGAVLVGTSLGHLSFAEVIGAYVACAAILVVLGLTGMVGRIMGAIPMPIVMAMVAGVFLPFVLAIVRALEDSFAMAAAMVLVFAGLSRVRTAGRAVPPVLGALAAGAVAIALQGTFELARPLELALARPNFYVPVFSLQAIAELAIPLAVTVFGIQNAQGFIVLRHAGYEPPENVLTTVCGLGSFAFAAFGSVPTCVTGPANAILNASGERATRYLAGMAMGVLAIAFGALAPFMTALGLALPASFIATLGGLAILGVLQGAFVTAFKGGFSLGALASFVVTISGVSILNIGAPFWGLVFGCAVSALLEPADFRRLRAGEAE